MCGLELGYNINLSKLTISLIKLGTLCEKLPDSRETGSHTVDFFSDEV